MMQTAKKVATHPKTTLKMYQAFTFLEPPTNPTPIVPPTWHCVVEMGIPRKDAMTTTNEAASSMQNPREGDMWVILYPREITIELDT
jgi:hypothetical protein